VWLGCLSAAAIARRRTSLPIRKTIAEGNSPASTFAKFRAPQGNVQRAGDLIRRVQPAESTEAEIDQDGNERTLRTRERTRSLKGSSSSKSSKSSSSSSSSKGKGGSSKSSGVSDADGTCSCSDEPDLRWLMIMMATECHLTRDNGKYYLSSAQVSPETWIFTDRPFDYAGSVTTKFFFENFDTIFNDGLGLPNAALTFSHAEDDRFDGPLVAVMVERIYEAPGTGLAGFELKQSSEQEKVLPIDTLFDMGGDEEIFSDCSFFIDSKDDLTEPAFDNQPRVRREWRTLDADTRQKVADAIWVMKETSTEDGIELYGPKFKNHDDLLLLHACATLDPRCDQGTSALGS